MCFCVMNFLSRMLLSYCLHYFLLCLDYKLEISMRLSKLSCITIEGEQSMVIVLLVSIY